MAALVVGVETDAGEADVGRHGLQCRKLAPRLVHSPKMGIGRYQNPVSHIEIGVLGPRATRPVQRLLIPSEIQVRIGEPGHSRPCVARAQVDGTMQASQRLVEVAGNNVRDPGVAQYENIVRVRGKCPPENL